MTAKTPSGPPTRRRKVLVTHERADELPLRARITNLKPRQSAEGALDGVQLDPRVIAEVAYGAGLKWRNADVLSMAIMVCLAESQGYTRAHCDNFRDNKDGSRTLLSRDCGIWQINIPAELVGTKQEERLYDPAINAQHAYALWIRRKWQPWVAYNTGTCFHDPYLQRAVLGVMNFLAERRVADAKARNAYQETRIPIFLTKQLPYTKK